MRVSTTVRSREATMPINLSKDIGPNMEKACRAYNPVLFGDDPARAHRAASPMMLEVAQLEVIHQLTPVVKVLCPAC